MQRPRRAVGLTAAALLLAGTVLSPLSAAALPNQIPVFKHQKDRYDYEPTHEGHEPAWNRIEKWNSAMLPSERFIKYCAMAQNSFRFYRGSNHLFFEEHLTPPDKRLDKFGGSAEDLTWTMGDLHPENIGSYDDSTGRVVYNVNDFDDAIVEDYQMELLRMSTGLILMSRSNGYDGDILYWIVRPFLEGYMDRIEALTKLNNSYPEPDSDIDRYKATGLVRKFLTDLEKNNDRQSMLDDQAPGGRFDRKSTKFEDIDDPAEEQDVRQAYAEVYPRTLSGNLKWDPEYFKIKDIARRTNSGTGSLGLPRYYALIEGPSKSSKDDVILDIKLQQIPTPVIFWDWLRREQYELQFGENHARGFVQASQAMQSNEDDHLGWLRTDKGTFSVRSRSPWKGGLDISLIKEKDQYKETTQQWGYIVANAHARGKGRWIANKNFVNHVWEKRLDKGKKKEDFVQLMWDIAMDFNGQVQKDYSNFLQNFKDLDRCGRLG